MTKKADILITAILSQQAQLHLENVICSIDILFNKAFHKERRLVAYLAGYSASYMKKGFIQLVTDYDVILNYRHHVPDDLSKVIVDDGNWSPDMIIGKAGLKKIQLVSNTPDEIRKKMDERHDYLMSIYEGFRGLVYNMEGFDKLTDDFLVEIESHYILPVPALRQMQTKAAFAAKTIWKTILGHAKVPSFVLPFLAFSYITQECHYDQRAYDEIEDDMEATPSDPAPHLAYGPLVEKRGICSGFAWAFWQMMKEANIECICIVGYLKEDTRIGHMWNMVKLDTQYYHVDATWGIREEGVFVSALLQPDSMMRITHIWKEEDYPQARGMRFTYDFIEDYLVDNGEGFLDDGAKVRYMYPEEIIE